MLAKHIMNITSIRIYPMKMHKHSTLLAYASVVFDDELVVHDIAIVNDGKLQVKLPGYKTKDGRYKTIVHPNNKELFNEIVSRVLEEFQK